MKNKNCFVYFTIFLIYGSGTTYFVHLIIIHRYLVILLMKSIHPVMAANLIKRASDRQFQNVL